MASPKPNAVEDHAKEHALAVDITDAQHHDLVAAQTCTVGPRTRGLPASKADRFGRRADALGLLQALAQGLIPEEAPGVLHGVDQRALVVTGRRLGLPGLHTRAGLRCCLSVNELGQRLIGLCLGWGRPIFLTPCAGAWLGLCRAKREELAKRGSFLPCSLTFRSSRKGCRGTVMHSTGSFDPQRPWIAQPEADVLLRYCAQFARQMIVIAVTLIGVPIRRQRRVRRASPSPPSYRQDRSPR
jgi:hypothetical protein